VIVKQAAPISLSALADLVDGRVVGDGELLISRLAPFDQAGPGEITFVSQEKYLRRLHETEAAAVVVAEELPAAIPLLICPNPYLAFARIQNYFFGSRPKPRGVMAGATVDPSAVLDADVTVYPGCYVGAGVKIGAGSILFPNVVLYDQVVIGADCLLHAGSIVREQCRLGDRVILQPGAVIGSDGFGFAPDGGSYDKIPQVGSVILEDDVEIGAGSCIDRAAIGVTLVERGCKLDNMVQVAHNVTVGADTVIAAQAGIAGSARIGRHCTFGGQAGVAGHIVVGENVTVGGRGGITSSVDSDQVLSGTPAMPHRDWLRASMAFPRLPELRRGLAKLQKEVRVLQDQLEKE